MIINIERPVNHRHVRYATSVRRENTALPLWNALRVGQHQVMGCRYSLCGLDKPYLSKICQTNDSDVVLVISFGWIPFNSKVIFFLTIYLTSKYTLLTSF